MPLELDGIKMRKKTQYCKKKKKKKHGPENQKTWVQVLILPSVGGGPAGRLLLLSSSQ